MAKIIDLGNGYGRLEGYGSKYGCLTFPLTLSEVRKLYVEGYLSNDEFHQALLDMGYSDGEAAWYTALDSITVEKWLARLPDARTI